MPTDLRKLVASPHWRWLPGMADEGGRRIMVVQFGVPWAWVKGSLAEISGQQRSMAWLPYCREEWADALPDPTDPATLGCLLSLVREAWGQPDIYVYRLRGGKWRVFSNRDCYPLMHGPTEFDALAAALLAAPEVTRG